jgi:hypothetical protein
MSVNADMGGFVGERGNGEKRILFAGKECDPARVVDGAARPERNGQTPSIPHWVG